MNNLAVLHLESENTKSHELSNPKLKTEDSGNDDKTAYKWTPDAHRRFAVATLALGISTVTPRYIEKALCDDRLNREKIGSHL